MHRCCAALALAACMSAPATADQPAADPQEASAPARTLPPTLPPAAATPPATIAPPPAAATKGGKNGGSVNAAAAAGAPSASTDRPPSPREAAEAALLRSAVPEPIDAARFRAMLDAIDPAHGSNKEIAEAFAIYHAAFVRIKEEPGRRIQLLLPAAYTFDASRAACDPRASPELIELLRLREKAALAAEDASRALFRSVELATPLERRTALNLERIALLRAYARRDGLLPSTSASLGDLVPKLRLEPDALAVANGTLAPYASALVTLLEARERLLRDGEARRAAIETDAGTLWRLGAASRVEATESLLAEVDDAEFAAELAIRDTHLAALRRLRSVLPRREGRALVEEWQRLVHPELFDDERILATVVEDTIALPELDPDADAALVEALDAAYGRLEPLAEAACAAADRMSPRLLERTPDAAAREVEANLALLAVQAKRRAVLRDALSRIRGIAGGAPVEALRRIDDLGLTIAALERADRFDRTSLEMLAAELAQAAARGESTGDGSRGEPPQGGGAGAAPDAGPPAAGNPPAGAGDRRAPRSSRGSRNPFNNP